MITIWGQFKFNIIAGYFKLGLEVLKSFCFKGVSANSVKT